jgi:hypothetical protein
MSGHGHVVPNPDGSKARCGGPAICSECARELASYGVMPRAKTVPIPGWEGSAGPFPAQYGLPHVYARDIHSGAGNCVCGLDLGHARHVQAAPGVDVPERMRHNRAPEDHRSGPDKVRDAVRAARGGDAPVQVQGFA